MGAASGQTNLIATNAFLTLVNAVGIWRWLGRQVSYEDGGRSAMGASRRTGHPSLFTGTSIAGMPVYDSDGGPLGKAVEALIECQTGTVSYVVIATSDAAGTNERLRAVPRIQVCFSCDALTLCFTAPAFEELEILEDGDWPAVVQH